MDNKIPEAVASVSYTVKSPKGYSLIFTMRGVDELELFERMKNMEGVLSGEGYIPEVKYGKGVPKEKEYVEGRVCPKCGEKLVYFEAKGKKHIKCSTQKWDFTTKKATGCEFVEWDDATPQTTPISTPSNGDTPTPAQMNILVEKGLYMEGMTKAQASETISQALGK